MVNVTVSHLPFLGGQKNRDNPHKNGICFCLASFVFHFSQRFQCSFDCVATNTLTPTSVRGFRTTLSALMQIFLIIQIIQM